jgi:hypothetical protein
MSVVVHGFLQERHIKRQCFIAKQKQVEPIASNRYKNPIGSSD